MSDLVLPVAWQPVWLRQVEARRRGLTSGQLAEAVADALRHGARFCEPGAGYTFVVDAESDDCATLTTAIARGEPLHLSA